MAELVSNQVKRLVEKNHLYDALVLLEDNLSDENQNDLIILKNRLIKIYEDRQLNLLKGNQYRIEESSIVKKILILNELLHKKGLAERSKNLKKLGFKPVDEQTLNKVKELNKKREIIKQESIEMIRQHDQLEERIREKESGIKAKSVLSFSTFLRTLENFFLLKYPRITLTLVTALIVALGFFLIKESPNSDFMISSAMKFTGALLAVMGIQIFLWLIGIRSPLLGND